MSEPAPKGMPMGERLRGEVRWVNETPDAGGMGICLLAVSAAVRVLLSSLGGDSGSPWAAGAAAGHA